VKWGKILVWYPVGVITPIQSAAMPNELLIANILGSGHARVRALGCPLLPSGSPLVTRDPVNHIDDLCWAAVPTFNGVANTIDFRAAAYGTVGANAVIVGNEATVAATGRLIAPGGYLFSDFFSGCVFFLFRAMSGGVYAVHSYRQSGTYPNPMPYMAAKNATLLYYFDTANRFTTAHYPVGTFGAVLVNVAANTITIDFFAFNGGTFDVLGVVDHQVINNWTTHNIPDPALGGTMAQWQPPVTPPAQRGLKAKVNKFYLKYIK